MANIEDNIGNLIMRQEHINQATQRSIVKFVTIITEKKRRSSNKAAPGLIPQRL